jgi:hypothetical protein
MLHEYHVICSVRYYPWFHKTAVGLGTYYPWIRGHYCIISCYCEQIFLFIYQDLRLSFNCRWCKRQAIAVGCYYSTSDSCNEVRGIKLHAEGLERLKVSARPVISTLTSGFTTWVSELLNPLPYCGYYVYRLP